MNTFTLTILLLFTALQVPAQLLSAYRSPDGYYVKFYKGDTLEFALPSNCYSGIICKKTMAGAGKLKKKKWVLRVQLNPRYIAEGQAAYQVAASATDSLYLKAAGKKVPFYVFGRTRPRDKWAYLLMKDRRTLQVTQMPADSLIMTYSMELGSCKIKLAQLKYLSYELTNNGAQTKIEYADMKHQLFDISYQMKGDTLGCTVNGPENYTRLCRYYP